MKRALERTIDAGLLFLIAFTPLAFGSVHIWALTTMELTVFALLAVWAVKSWLYGAESAGRGLAPLYVAAFIFLASAFLQAVPLPLWAVERLSPRAFDLYTMQPPGLDGMAGGGKAYLSIYPYKTRMEVAKYASYIGVFFLIAHEMRERKRAVRLLAALVAMASFEALYGLYGYFSDDHVIFGYLNVHAHGSATGTFVNRNHFAGYLGITVFAGTGYLMALLSSAAVGGPAKGRRRLADYLGGAASPWAAALLVGVVTSAVGIFFSLSRAGVFSFVSASLFISAMAFISGRRGTTAVLVVLLVMALGAAAWYGTEPLDRRFMVSEVDFRAGRLPIWSASMEIIRGFPLFGPGLGTYEDAFRLYRPAGVAVRMEHAHNDYLEALSEVGGAGFVPIAVGLVWFSVLLIRRWLTARDPFARGLSLAGMGAAAYVLLHSATDFNMHIPANAVALAAVAALSYASSSPEVNERGRHMRPAGRLALVALVAVLSALGYFSACRWLAEASYPIQRSFTRSEEAGLVPGKEDAGRIARSISLAPGVSEYHVLLGKHHAYGAGKGDAERAASLEKAEREYMAALSLNPSNTEALSYLGWVRFAMGKPLEAVGLLEKALAVEPNNYFVHIFYGMGVSEFLGEFPQGMRRVYTYRGLSEFRKGIELNPSMAGNPSVAAGMADLYIEKGDAAKAMEVLGGLRGTDPLSLASRLKLAGLYLDRGRGGEAMKVFGALLEGPGMDGGARAGVLAALEAEAEKHPEEPGLKLLLGEAYAKGGAHGKAARALEGFLRARPGAAEAHYLLGEAYEALGDREAANREYIRTLELEGGHEAASRKVSEYYRRALGGARGK